MDPSVTAFNASVGDLQILQTRGAGTEATRAAVTNVLETAAREGMDMQTIHVADRNLAALRDTTDPAGRSARESIVRLRNATYDNLGWINRKSADISSSMWNIDGLLRKN